LALQWNLAWEDKAENFARVRRMLEQVDVRPGSLLVLPEMFTTGFSLNLAATRQGSPPEGEHFLADLARCLNATVVGGVVSGAQDDPDRGRNQCVAFGPEGNLLARYTKLHPFTPGAEQAVHQAGDRVELFAWQGFRVAPFICYDLRFPEVFRQATQQGATLLLVIANWPARRERHWLTLLQARAIENQAYVVGVNRCGRDPLATYAGRSIVIDPKGILVADAGEDEGCLSAALNLAALQQWRREFPVLADQRA
jgi:predicted amidohydrolase